MMTTRLALLAGAVMTLTTCQHSVLTAPNPEEVAADLIARNVAVLDGTTTVMRFPPPPIYAMWRAEIEQCSGLTRDGAATFWVAQTVILNTSGALGLYVRPDRRIILGLGYETVAWVVRHELLHDLMDTPHAAEHHPPEFFRAKCGTLVYPSPVIPQQTPPQTARAYT